MLTGKNWDHSIQQNIYWKRTLAASDLFHMFIWSIKFYAFLFHILKNANVWKRWFIKCSYQQVLWQNLSWNLSKYKKTIFLRGFILNLKERAKIFLKKSTRDFPNRPPFVKLSESLEILNDFCTLTLKQNFWKTTPFFKNLEYRFWVESIKIKNAKTQHFQTKQKSMLR